MKSRFKSLRRTSSRQLATAMDSDPHSLTNETSGSFAVRTSSGTLYAAHLDPPREIVRLHNDRQPVPRYAHLPAAELRRDGEAVKLLNIVEIQVGRRGLMLLDVRLDGIPTLRGTTEVVSISRLKDDGDTGGQVE